MAAGANVVTANGLGIENWTTPTIPGLKVLYGTGLNDFVAFV